MRGLPLILLLLLIACPSAATAYEVLPIFSAARQVQGLTADQLARISRLESETAMRLESAQERLTVLEKRLAVVKTHPHERIWIQRQPLPQSTALKREIAEVSQSLEKRRQEALKSLQAILTGEQRAEFDGMPSVKAMQPQPIVIDQGQAKMPEKARKRGTVFGALMRKLGKRSS